MPRSTDRNTTIHRLFDALLAAYGPQGWWPGNSPAEIIIGAILTQNTNWKNVEKAIGQMRAAGLIDWAALRDVPHTRLSECIRPAGYYNLKARRLKNFVGWLWDHHAGILADLDDVPLSGLREQLLGINGIGPETADAILLYAFDRPTFVVDAYTGRVARRHGLIDGKASYANIKAIFEASLPADAPLFNEYHALLVEVGKRHCRPAAQCEGCPLAGFEHDGNLK